MSLINFFDNRRYWLEKRNPVLNRIKFYGFWNRVVDIAANLILPLYFAATRNNKKYTLANAPKRDKQVIVSLTSFPIRIPELWKVTECLLRQSVKPNKIVLYLTASQVPDIEKLPKSLLNQRQRGLEIRLCREEVRSHTKYFGAFRDFPDDIIITVDDDLFYRTDVVENQLKNHEKYPNAIVCNWAKRILPTTPLYSEWPDVNEPELGNNFLLLGVTSVLYPPHCMYKDILNDKLIRDLSLTADDVWLSAMARLAGTPIYRAPYYPHQTPVKIENNTTLLSVNRERNQKCVDNINAYYRDTIGKAPFNDHIK